MKTLTTLLCTILIFSQTSFAQLDSIFDQNTWRTFLVHLPTNYNSNTTHAVVLNLHGLGADAQQQQTYSQFNPIADSLGFIVVYPNAISNSWTSIGNSDVDFLTNLVGHIRNTYATNNCLFVTGFSQGGFMTAKFATTTSLPINAIAVASGNMAKATQNNAESAPKIPYMHFHGTDDNIVPFNGSSQLIPPVDSTILWWVTHNNSQYSPVVTMLPNTNTTDNSTVEKYHYPATVAGPEVIFYKVINGGHTWSGSYNVNAFGNTNQDINQSQLIGEFFHKHCLGTVGISNEHVYAPATIYPNPFKQHITISHSNLTESTFTLYNSVGQMILNQELGMQSQINTTDLPKGLYFYELKSTTQTLQTGKLIKE